MTMTAEDAILQACANVGILPPKARGYGRWLKTDTLAGKSGKGDGRVVVNDSNVTAWNWQTGEKATVWLKDKPTAVERRQMAQQIEEAKAQKRARAKRVSASASRLVDAAQLSTHPYLVGKGFREEKALVVGADAVISLATDSVTGISGKYLVPEGAARAIVISARIGTMVSSVQLIWEDGTKKFLFGGEMSGASHRISRGGSTWLCEGFATGLSLRAALKGLGLSATILCCFSAYNVVVIARSITGRCFIAAENDKPIAQYGGLGTSEYFARQTSRPFLKPLVGSDINDMHMSEGIFAVQRHIANFLKGAAM
ncbi:hypothetical protein MesoLjLc_45480 [Mesorhizobium sp. L-8-10]|uniref:hypothetical protein n=1 Tax=Mesorhizobium sp. L-8-10 TaxID=2744523 RepID=UPI0019261705|nr:hypothetical protein [Mesorhizobium sp. L-8-10]BCH32618.1 hypothetical protein MesoLjLc_45480 [Mesorhizobium sp. L-8-10]